MLNLESKPHCFFPRNLLLFSLLAKATNGSSPFSREPIENHLYSDIAQNFETVPINLPESDSKMTADQGFTSKNLPQFKVKDTF